MNITFKGEQWMTVQPSITNKHLKLENTYIELPTSFYTQVNPAQVPNPKLILFNTSLAEELGLNEEFLTSDEGIEFLIGNRILEGSTPIAQAYAGHQFGYFTMLGDGRAILLGEYVSKDDQRYDIQLKGSGQTPYSRRGDGKAALGPMLREYIISEGMQALGIPTTRSLAVLTTGEIVMRETPLEGAILVRIAESHIRVGTFQYAAKWGGIEALKALADYTLKRHFKEGLSQKDPYLYLLEEVVKKQAQLIAKWQLVGFIHGVMNTDNMTISGETIDYGPCAFMDTYHLNTVFSSIDHEGRYAYGNQPKIGGWNLARFAETLLPLLHEDKEKAVELAQKIVSKFTTFYKTYWLEGMRKKLGLFSEEAEDELLIQKLLRMMQEQKADYTNTFKDLTLGDLSKEPLFKTEEFNAWHQSWEERLERQEQSREEIKTLMQQNNPVVIPRNHRVEEALEYATLKGDMSKLNQLLEVIRRPYDYTQINEYYTTVPATNGQCYKTYCGT